MFWHEITDLGPIDPTKPLNSKVMRILRRFLIRNKANKKFYKNKSYEITMDGIPYKFTLSHDILYRPRESMVDQDRFEVISNDERPVGKGASGTFHKIVGTLIPELGGKLKYVDKTRGVKRQEHMDDTEIAAAIREYELTKRVSSE